MLDSTLSDNSSDRNGGGIRTSSGNVSLTASTLSGNSSGSRGAVTAVGYTLGGIYISSGEVSLVNSTLSGNSSVGEGGGIRTSSGNVSLNASTLSGNSSDRNGGGIRNYSGNVSLTNSTLSGNSSGGDGGGIWSDDSRVLIVNSTVTGNSTLGVGGGIGLIADDADDTSRLTIRNSIVAGNTDNGTAPDVEAIGDVVNDLIVENSLIGDTTGSGITTTTGTGNILNENALLAALADNGGPTQTHRLLPGSLAIDAGSNALAVDQDGNALASDQRGEDRIAFGTVDIGAYELQSTTIGPRVISTVRDEGGVLARPDLLNTFSVSFDQDVNVSAGDLFVDNETFGFAVDTSSVGFGYDAATLTATWDFSSLVLDAAFYSFELSETITGVIGGFRLDGDGDGDGVAGSNSFESVYVAIPGDANLDGQVDVLNDGFALVANLNTTTNAVFADGDFNGDGQVDVLGDAFILVANLGRDVRLPATALGGSGIVQSSVSLPAQQSSVTVPVPVSADADEQESLTATGSTSPTSKQPQLVLAGDHDLRDDVFGSNF